MGRNAKGKQPKLTPEVIDTIHNVLANGNTIRTACQAARISEGSYFSWIAKGEAGDRGNKGLYLELLEKVNEAKAVTKITAVGILQNAGKADWRAIAWLLERTYGREYGNRQTHEVSGIGPDSANGPSGPLPGVPFQVNLTISPPPSKE